MRSQKEVEEALKDKSDAGNRVLMLFFGIFLTFVVLVSIIFGVMSLAAFAMGLMQQYSPPPSPPPSPLFPLPRPPPTSPPPTSPSPRFPPGNPSDRPQEPPPPPSTPPPHLPYPPVSPVAEVTCTAATTRNACAAQQVRFGLAHGESQAANGILSTGSPTDVGACSFCISNHKTAFTLDADIPAGMDATSYCSTVAVSGVCYCVC